MIWNIVLADKLPNSYQPEIFWKDIPSFLTYGENISRIFVFILSFLMPINFSTNIQKKGLLIYVFGTILYFSSWLFLIYFPDSRWSNNAIGFMSPAYTPLIWLTGIGLIGNSFYFNLPFKRWLFFLISLIFLIFHNYHALIIFLRTH